MRRGLRHTSDGVRICIWVELEVCINYSRFILRDMAVEVTAGRLLDRQILHVPEANTPFTSPQNARHQSMQLCGLQTTNEKFSHKFSFFP